MSIRLNGSTSGYTEIDAPAVAGSNTLVLPTGNGSSGQYLQTNGSGTLSWAGVSGLPAQALTLGTAVASTSGTSIDFTSIPSTVKRITVMFNGVSTNGTSLIQVQIGSGSFITSGYASQYSTNGASGSLASGFLTSYRPSAANTLRGHMVICLISGSTYTVSSIFGGGGGTDDVTSAAGALSLSGTLDRIRITTVNGTDTFDAGTINIMYEG